MELYSKYVVKRCLNVFVSVIGVCFCIFLCNTQTAKAQNAKQELVVAFFKDAIDRNIADEQLIKKYMCNDLPAPTDQKAREAHEFFTQQVYRLRMKLLGQSKKITEHFGNTITAYKDLPENEQYIVTEKKQEDNIFRFKGEQGIMFDILLGNGRILTFSTMNKGGKKVFTLLCD